MIDKNPKSELKVGKFLVNGEIRGFLKSVSDPQELSRGNKVRNDYFFFTIEFYRYNDQNVNGVAKVYITSENLGIGSSDGVIFYPSNDPSKPNEELKTAIVNPERIVGERIGIRGMIKDDCKNGYTHFMTKIKKVKIFPDPKTYLKKVN